MNLTKEVDHVLHLNRIGKMSDKTALDNIKSLIKKWEKEQREPNVFVVGQKIKEIRIKKGLTQKEFAKRTNSTIPAISNWENGRNLPNKERLKAIAELGEKSVYDLLY